MKFIYSIILFLCVASNYIKAQATSPYKNGDLIFIENPSGQGKAIQLATKSKYTHVGIIFIENNRPMVYYAVEPVSVNTVEEFIAMSSDGKYSLKRLKDAALLTTDVTKSMLKEAKSKLNIHYDLGFNWSDDELYCSEFVWKLYNSHLHIEIGKLKALKEFDLSHPTVKSIMQKRYGKNIPFEEKMISPGDMYNSELLK